MSSWEWLLYCTVLHCTVLYLPYCYFSCWYTPLNQAIYAWSFRQKVCWVGGGGWWHCNYSYKLQGSRGDLESLSLVELDSRPIESNSWTPSLSIMVIIWCVSLISLSFLLSARSRQTSSSNLVYDCIGADTRPGTQEGPHIQHGQHHCLDWISSGRRTVHQDQYFVHFHFQT